MLNGPGYLVHLWDPSAEPPDSYWCYESWEAAHRRIAQILPIYAYALDHAHYRELHSRRRTPRKYEDFLATELRPRPDAEYRFADARLSCYTAQ